MKKQALTTFIVLIVAGLLLVACQPAASSEAPSAPQQEEEAEAMQEPAPTPEAAEEAGSGMSTDAMFDPAFGISAENVGLVYESLLKTGEEGLIPVLALGATVSDDGLDYIINLRPGVSFHDGSLLNADAVVANFDRWSDEANGMETWVANFGGFKGQTDADGKSLSIYDGIEKVDELTVLVHLNTPDADFLNKLADPAFAIVNPAALDAPYFGSASGVDGGTGPYMLGEWRNTGLTLEPFASYWNPNAVPANSMDVTFE